MIHDLEGAHLALGVKAFINRIPSSATLSNEGVFTQSQPYAPACGKDWSSAMQKRMLGCELVVSGFVQPAIRRVIRTMKRKALNLILLDDLCSINYALKPASEFTMIFLKLYIEVP